MTQACFKISKFSFSSCWRAAVSAATQHCTQSDPQQQKAFNQKARRMKQRQRIVMDDTTSFNQQRQHVIATFRQENHSSTDTAVVFPSKSGPFSLSPSVVIDSFSFPNNLAVITKAVAVVLPILKVNSFACSSSLPSLYQELCHIIDHRIFFTIRSLSDGINFLIFCKLIFTNSRMRFDISCTEPPCSFLPRNANFSQCPRLMAALA